MLRTTSLLMSVLFVTGIGGCTRQHLIVLNEYAPVNSGAEPAEVSVALRIEDARGAETQGGNPADVGVVNDVLETTLLSVSTPAVVRDLVAAATTDGLHLAHIAVSPRAPRTLVVIIRKFWVAVPSREAHVIAGFRLEDRDGQALWTGAAAGQAGGRIWVPSMLLDVYQRSLADYAKNASLAFEKPDFQRQLY